MPSGGAQLLWLDESWRLSSSPDARAVFAKNRLRLAEELGGVASEAPAAPGPGDCAR